MKVRSSRLSHISLTYLILKKRGQETKGKEEIKKLKKEDETNWK